MSFKTTNYTDYTNCCARCSPIVTLRASGFTSN